MVASNETSEHPEANFTFQFEDSHSDVQTMLNNIENLLAAGARESYCSQRMLLRQFPPWQAVAKGIPFVIGDYKQQPAKPSDAVWATFVGHDMRALGVVAGKIAVDYLKTLNKPNPVCLCSYLVPPLDRFQKDRFEGFRDTVLASLFPQSQGHRRRRCGCWE